VEGQLQGLRRADKIWRQLNRDNIPVARCTVERLMRDLGIRGATCARRHVTTFLADDATRPADLVKRAFSAPALNKLWVADLTYVRPTRASATSRSLRTDLALDALEQAI
jgi:putative transposase